MNKGSPKASCPKGVKTGSPKAVAPKGVKVGSPKVKGGL